MISKTLAVVTASHVSEGAVLLVQAAKARGYDASTVLVNDDDVTTRIATADEVIFRISPNTVELYKLLVQQLAGKARRSLESTLLAFDKAATYELFQAHTIPTPISYSINRSQGIAKYPVVAKIYNGNQGRGVQLVTNDADLNAFKAAFPSMKEFLIQEYIEESKGTDKRLLIVRDSCVAAMQRMTTTGDFRANLHLGASATAYTPTDEEVRLAVDALNAFDLSFAGVDIIDSNKGPLVLEVNPSPGFNIQSFVSVNVVDEVIKGVMND